MKARIHHAALNVTDLGWYQDFFMNTFGMTVSRTAGEAPHRIVWFAEGIQLNEMPEGAEAVPGNLVDHLSLGTETDPSEAAAIAIQAGCRPVPGKKPYWFSLPNGVLVELKPL